MKKIILFTLLCTVLSCRGQTESKELISSFEYLMEEVLKTKSKEELGLLRNEIFARKGYVFNSATLQKYFSDKDWYTPNPNLKITFTDEETTFINKIKKLENLRLTLQNSKSYQSVNCIDKIDDENNIYPITFEMTEDYRFYDKIEKAELNMFDNDKIKDISCEGITYKIKCFDQIEYLLIPTALCGNDKTFLALIKEGKTEIKNIYGAQSRYERLDYVLTKDFLEIIKTDYYEYEADQKRDEVKIKKTSKKYKLTETGLVKF